MLEKIKQKLTPELKKQILRYVIVGFTTFFIDFGILHLLIAIYGDGFYFIGAAISFSIATVFNYLLSVHYVFKARKQNFKEFMIYLLPTIGGLLINQLIMWLGHGVINLPVWFTKCAAEGVVMVYNFVMRKLFLEDHSHA